MLPNIRLNYEYGPRNFTYIYISNPEFMKFFGWYITPSPRLFFSISEINEIDDWCKKNLKGRWKISASNLFIQDEEDLVLFKLSR